MNYAGMDYDVIIVGGGMVGATLACALGEAKLRVAVVDRTALSAGWRPEEDVDSRVSAVSRASQRIFDALGVWQAMQARRVTPFLEMHVWDGDGVIHFDSADIGEPAMGYIIENSVIVDALLERMGHLDNVVLLGSTDVAALSPKDQKVALHLTDGRALCSALVVGADGASSRVRELAGIETLGWAYDQDAVVATVATELAHQYTAWQRFLPDGPLAFLPLCSGQSSIVWSTSPQHAHALLAFDKETFCDALGVAFEHRLGRVLNVGQRAKFPLKLQHALRYVAPRVALVGDAAHTIHPLAGQGANLGFLDAAVLAEILEDAAGRSQDIGAYKVLRKYERWRKGDNLITMSVMDGFKRVFGSSDKATRAVRTLGLNTADHLGPLKHWLMCQAMGLVSDLPKLARGG